MSEYVYVCHSVCMSNIYLITAESSTLDPHKQLHNFVYEVQGEM